jgi:antitoxin (DNA-binding transcriptional repressor) of toxin-antitoxin stability system
MRRITMSEARTHLSRILREAVAGESFVITKNGKPLVRMDAVAQAMEKPVGDKES